jgi:uncharacterized repeat protein (TIGR04076 family)
MVRITVVKKPVFEDLISVIEDSRYLPFSECKEFELGQEFIYKESKPDGFCDAAWEDIKRDVLMIEAGDSPEIKLKEPNTTYASCTEGFRTVIFKIEKM